jgi:hypothetical protein
LAVLEAAVVTYTQAVAMQNYVAIKIIIMLKKHLAEHSIQTESQLVQSNILSLCVFNNGKGKQKGKQSLPIRVVGRK